MTVKAIPDGYHSITPYLSIKGASDAIEFYKKAFGAVELFRLAMPDGIIGHAEVQIGNSRIMIADPCDDVSFGDPKTLGASTVGLYVYVNDVDAMYSQAVVAGAKTVQPVEDQFYGDRTGTLEDPYGHRWFLATHKEDLTPEELNKRAERLFKPDASC
jgi:PhnB protein